MIDAVRWVASGWVKGARHSEETYNTMLAASPVPPQADDTGVGDGLVLWNRLKEILGRNRVDLSSGEQASLNEIYSALVASPPASSARAHRVMTPEEYAALNIIGWHAICRNIDVAGNVGVRFGGFSFGAETTTPEGK